MQAHEIESLTRAVRAGDASAAAQLVPWAQKSGDFDLALLCMRLLEPQRFYAWQALQACTSIAPVKMGSSATTQALRSEIVARALVEGALRRGVEDEIAKEMLDLASFVLDVRRDPRKHQELGDELQIAVAARMALLSSTEAHTLSALRSLRAGLQRRFSEQNL
ncbi:MAG: hypothetical protein RBU37_15965 [Myxococcota bacterium]|nr:hypothetical protein [Myxococcota bacterium]